MKHTWFSEQYIYIKLCILQKNYNKRYITNNKIKKSFKSQVQGFSEQHKSLYITKKL